MTRILIVDDSPTQLNVISRVLTKHGYEIITAEDGEIGVQKAVNEKPDIILMDVVMPNLNGFQATRQITRNPATSHIPVIMLTSKDQDTDKVWAERQGAADYLTKPPNESDLIVKIKAFAQGKTA
jgi:twitching motility two-component system response regulator PilH